MDMPLHDVLFVVLAVFALARLSDLGVVEIGVLLACVAGSIVGVLAACQHTGSVIVWGAGATGLVFLMGVQQTVRRLIGREMPATPGLFCAAAGKDAVCGFAVGSLVASSLMLLFSDVGVPGAENLARLVLHVAPAAVGLGVQWWFIMRALGRLHAHLAVQRQAAEAGTNL